MYTEIGQIIRGALANDKQKVLSYAWLLAENLSKDGDDRSAAMVRRATGDLPAGNPVTLDETTSTAPALFGKSPEQKTIDVLKLMLHTLVKVLRRKDLSVDESRKVDKADDYLRSLFTASDVLR